LKLAVIHLKTNNCFFKQVLLEGWVVDGRMDDRMNILMVGYMKNVLMDGWMDVGWVN
jgi:hypothetical protein